MPTVILIDDPNDPRLADYREVRERDLVGRRGAFIAEGVVVLQKLIRSGRHPIRSLLVAEKRMAGLRSLLAELGPSVAVYVASQAVMDTVVGFPIHRGVLAAGTRAEPDLDVLLRGLPRNALVLGLVGIANHDNMGGLFRNAAAFGADAVLVDDGCCDPLYRKSIRVSVGAALTMPFARAGSPSDLVSNLQARDFSIVALSPRGQVELSDLKPAARSAILFGAEGPGLPATVIDRVDTVRIRMAGGFDSLNVATTSGIVLHHMVVSAPIKPQHGALS